ncbi:MAG: fumarylacetoacetate hydrolase family protein [Sphingomonadales bacterium]|nr:fumarylacetoacetate hydrolase family protein [Sphingomonadales bacterium]
MTAMSEYVFSPSTPPSLPVAGSDARFPIHRIYCIGRNYAEHVREMGREPDRGAPMFFLKPADTIVENGTTIPIPPGTENFHFEIELVAAIGKEGRNIPTESALDLVFGYGVGNDLTRRDLQLAMRDKGWPWEIGKSFEHCAACTAIHPVAEIGHPLENDIWLDQNGTRRQSGNTREMIFNLQEQISYLSELYVLRPGDLLFTGTPAGVGPIAAGDTLVGGVDGVDELTNTFR